MVLKHGLNMVKEYSALVMQGTLDYAGDTIYVCKHSMRQYIFLIWAFNFSGSCYYLRIGYDNLLTI